MRFERVFDVNLNAPVEPRMCGGLLFTGDNESLTVRARVRRGAASEAVTGSVVAHAIRADGSTVVVDGEASGNEASASLPASSLACEGPLGVMLRVIEGDEKTTILKAVWDVTAGTTETIIDPGHVVPDVDDVIAMMDQAEDAIDAANAAAAAADAAVGNLQGALFVSATYALEFMQGSINSSTGSASTQNYDKRLRTTSDVWYNVAGGLTIAVPDGFRAYLYYYDYNAADGKYTYKGNSGGWKTGAYADAAPAGNFLRVVLARGDDANLTPEDVTTPVVVEAAASTDETLSIPGKAADAKRVAEAIASCFKYGGLINEDTDLDDLKTPGLYYRWTSSHRPGNCPTAYGGSVMCFGQTGVNYQLAINSAGNLFARGTTGTGDGSYQEAWNQFAKQGDVDTAISAIRADASRQTKDIAAEGILVASASGAATTINPSGKWVSQASSSAAAYVLPVPSGVKKISMITPTAGAIYAFLASYDTPVAGETPDFAPAYPARIVTADAGYVEHRIDNTIKYMYILMATSSGADVSPTDLRYHWDYVPEKLQELPTLYLSGETAGMSKENAVTMNYSIFGQTGTCTVKWQGSSSQRYVKKNYTIKFDTGFDGWAKWATFVNALRSKNGNISTIPTASRWGTQTKYCTKANWIDPSAARNIVCARLWGQIVKDRVTKGDVTDSRKDAPNYGAIDGFPIEIMINNETAGLYTLNIPKDSWQFAMGEGAAEYIVSGEDNSKQACRWKATALLDGTDYSVEYAPDGVEDATIAASLNAAISAAINAGANWETELASYLDVDSVIDYFIFTCCVNNNDAMARRPGSRWRGAAATSRRRRT